jgi:hypothetical protein
MSDASNVAKNLRERFGVTTEERLGKAFSELLENPLLTGAIGRAFDAREKAAQAQEVAMGALNLPSAADIERLTRRLRSVSHRLEGIEDGVDRLDRALSPTGVEARLSAIEEQLRTLMGRLERAPAAGSPRTAAPMAAAKAGAPRARPRTSAKAAANAKAAATAKAAAKRKPTTASKASARGVKAVAKARPAAGKPKASS